MNEENNPKQPVTDTYLLRRRMAREESEGIGFREPGNPYEAIRQAADVIRDTVPEGVIDPKTRQRG